MKTKTNKILSTVLLIMFLISSIPINSFANFITDINSNANFGVISGSLAEYNHELHYADYDGARYIVFCTECGKRSPSGSVDYVYGNDFLAKFKEDRAEYKQIAEMVYFGYGMKHGMGVPEDYEAQKDACATQQYVWEYIHNNINESARIVDRDSWNGAYMNSDIYAQWLEETERYYNEFHSNVSFNGITSEVNAGDTTSITDSNGVLQGYDNFSRTINGVTFSHDKGSNELKVLANGDSTGNVTFNSKDNGIYTLMPNGSTYDSGTMSNYVLIEFTSGSVQNVMFSNYVDPSFFSVTVGVQSGKFILRKTNSEGDRIAGCTFGIYSDEACTQEIARGTTNDNGEFEINPIKVGIAYVKELSVPKGYLISSELKRVEVIAGQTATADFTNGEPLGKIVITKANENGDLIEGATFVVKAGETITNTAGTKTLYTKDQEVATVVTRKGTATVENLPYGKYFIQEKSAPDGYLLNTQTYIANIEYQDGATPVIEVKVGNILNAEPRGKIIINKGSSNHDPITGAVMQVIANDSITNKEKTKIYYNKGDIVATLTTNNGVAVLDNIPLGKYIVKEKTQLLMGI